jgi:uncharacterized protein DUF551
MNALAAEWTSTSRSADREQWPRIKVAIPADLMPKDSDVPIRVETQNTLREQVIRRAALRRHNHRNIAGRPRRRPPHRMPSTRTRWVSVKERLPEAEQFVLVFVKAPTATYVSAAYWDEECFWEHNWPWTVTDISHWMPLPAAPDGNDLQPTEPGLPARCAVEPPLPESFAPVSPVTQEAGLFRSVGRWRWLLIPAVWGLATLCFFLH